MMVLLSLMTSDTMVPKAAIFSEGLALVLTLLLFLSLSYRHPPGGAAIAVGGDGASPSPPVGPTFFGSVLSVYFQPSAAY